MRLLFQCLVLALPAVVKLQYMSKGVDGCVDVGCQECEGDCDNDNECAGVLVSDQKKERKKYTSGGDITPAQYIPLGSHAARLCWKKCQT